MTYFSTLDNSITGWSSFGNRTLPQNSAKTMTFRRYDSNVVPKSHKGWFRIIEKKEDNTRIGTM